MAALPAALALPPVTRLSARVTRVMGMNPSAMTLGGTNTYLVGQGRQRVLIDTGEGAPDYLPVLERALREASEVVGERVEIAQVLFTHWHPDHVGGIAQVRQLFPDVVTRKLPTVMLPEGGSGEGSREEARAQRLADEEVIALDGGATTLSVMSTPGHTDDHASIVLVEESAVFTGDCVLGAGSSVFACYHDFMRSLDRIKRHQPAVLYPGHGPHVAEAGPYIDKYIAHRRQREEQILAALAARAKAADQSNAAMSIDEIVTSIYAATTPPQLLGAAAVNVSHQLKKLLREGAVSCSSDGASPEDARRFVLGVDDYATSAGGGSISRAVAAKESSSTGGGEPSGKPGCDACEKAANDGAALLLRFKTLRWRSQL
jgi:ribonuclease/clavin/mitogillin